MNITKPIQLLITEMDKGEIPLDILMMCNNVFVKQDSTHFRCIKCRSGKFDHGDICTVEDIRQRIWSLTE